MAIYKCGVCGETMERDLIVFTDHTEQHIINVIKRKHPDWAQKDGVCKKCFKYYKDAHEGEGK